MSREILKLEHHHNLRDLSAGGMRFYNEREGGNVRLGDIIYYAEDDAHGVVVDEMNAEHTHCFSVARGERGGGGIDASWNVNSRRDVDVLGTVFKPGASGRLTIEGGPVYTDFKSPTAENYLRVAAKGRSVDFTVIKVLERGRKILCGIGRPWQSRRVHAVLHPRELWLQYYSPHEGETRFEELQFPVERIDYKTRLDAPFDIAGEFVKTAKEIGWPYAAAAGAAERFVDAKRELARRLGLGSDLRRTVAIDGGGDPTLRGNIRNYILQACGDWPFTLNPPEVRTDKGKMKLTRYLTKHGGEMSIYAKDDLYMALNRAPNYEASHETCITMLGELLSRKLEVTISCNPSDFITSSHNGGFSSCFRPGGEYANTNLSYADHPGVALVYVGTPNKKTGRAWVFIGEGLDWVLMQKGYGLFPEDARTLARRAICELLGAKEDWIREDAVTAGNLLVKRMGYLDNGGSNFVSINGAPAGRTPIGPAVCLQCGEETTSPRRGACSSCRPNRRCCCCEDEVEEDAVYSNNDGDIFCEECYCDRHTSCDRCGAEVNRDDVLHAGDGVYCCSDCAERDGYVACGYCGAMVHHDDAIHGYCVESCADAQLDRCPDCGDFYPDGASFDGGDTCENCGAEADRCPECSALYAYGESYEEGDECPSCGACQPESAEEAVVESEEA